jgi:hypothetical protein
MITVLTSTGCASENRSPAGSPGLSSQLVGRFARRYIA